MSATGLDQEEVDEVADEQTDLERIDRLRRGAYGGAVSDALIGLGVVNTALSADFRAIRQGMVIAGRALPVRARPVGTPPAALDDVLRGRPTAPRDAPVPQRELMRAIRARMPGTIVCFDAGGDRSDAHFGELSATLAMSQGARGVLMNGNLRDIARIVELSDFSAFTTGTTPNAYVLIEIVGIGEPAPFPGRLTPYVYIRPGDFIFGDDDGVIVIPEAVVDELIDRVEMLTGRERHERALIADGMDIDDVYEQIGVL
jgi:regulator of RNase E activity RraA